jgi:hypothetical protein
MWMKIAQPIPVEALFNRAISPAFKLPAWLSAEGVTFFSARSLKSAQMTGFVDWSLSLLRIPSICPLYGSNQAFSQSSVLHSGREVH